MLQLGSLILGRDIVNVILILVLRLLKNIMINIMIESNWFIPSHLEIYLIDLLVCLVFPLLCCLSETVTIEMKCQ